MAAKVQKTIVEKLLDQKKIPHNSYEYGDGSGDFMDGKEVADAIGKPYEQVFKTLVCIGPKGNCVFVVPVENDTCKGYNKNHRLHQRRLQPYWYEKTVPDIHRFHRTEF